MLNKLQAVKNDNKHLEMMRVSTLRNMVVIDLASTIYDYDFIPLGLEMFLQDKDYDWYDSTTIHILAK